MSRTTTWRKLPVALTELSLATTLRCGQSFRWKQCDDRTWACTLRGRIIQLDQDDTHLRYRAVWPANETSPPAPSNLTPENGVEDNDDTGEFIQHYLNLQPNLKDLYEQWSMSDANFRKKAPRFTGVRILRQDAWEALIGFICSSNNNIIRISQMVDKLCRHYGPFIADLEGNAYFDFPPPTALTGKNVESHLRELGFGYRAKYISQTARMIVDHGHHDWLDNLRNPESPVFGRETAPAGDMKPEGRYGYREAHEKLLGLTGVGPKVADCVCLMGLGWGEAVPVDTHVWQIAQRDYKFGRGKHSSLTKATYDAVANHFRKLWGKEAGWAHSVLFTADLRAFSDRLAIKVEANTEPLRTATDLSIVEKDTVEPKPLEKAIAQVKRVIDEVETKPEIEVEGTTAGERVKRRRRR